MALYTMKEILEDADKRKYGVGFYDVTNLEMVRACIEAAEELRSPIIIGPAESLLATTPYEYIAPMCIEAARRASVPVAVHLDHCYHFETLMQALKYGFGSIMYDGSRKTYEENVESSREIARIAHAFGAGLECELGCVGGLENEEGVKDETVYTDVEQAGDFVERTGVDFLAVSIGTVHGVYMEEPKLNLERLKAIKTRVNIPLVLHGGSGLSDDDFRNCVRDGISKVNIFTDVILAAKQSVQDAQARDAAYLDSQRMAIDAMKQVVIEKTKLFGSDGKA